MYNLELDRVIKDIKEKNHKKVLFQLPDGLKPQGKEICDTVQKETGAICYIWFSSCYGACDLPQGIDALGIDLLVQFGHNLFIKKEW